MNDKDGAHTDVDVRVDFDAACNRLMVQINIMRLLSHLHWSLWGIYAGSARGYVYEGSEGKGKDVECAGFDYFAYAYGRMEWWREHRKEVATILDG